MPKSQHLNASLPLVNAIENQVRPCHDFPYIGPAPDPSTPMRQLTQGFSLIEKIRTQPLRRAGIIRDDIAADLLDVIQRQR